MGQPLHSLIFISSSYTCNLHLLHFAEKPALAIVDVDYTYYFLLTSPRQRTNGRCGIQQNDPNIILASLKKYYRMRVSKSGTIHKLAKINNNNNQIPRPTIDVIYI